MSNKAGRPSLGKDKRNCQVMVAFNETELSIVNMRARKAGLPLASYCRLCALGTTVRQRITPELLKAIQALYPIGNNLNQIAHRLNTGLYPGTVRDVTSALQDLRVLTKAINKLLEQP